MANYIYCIVPMCRNSTATTPHKVFFRVPNDPVIRKKWCDAMKRDPKKNKPLSSKTNRYVCEDHFELETDMENYSRYKLQGGRKFLKPGVMPHVFECQKTKATPPPRERTIKRLRKEMVEEILNASVQPTSPVDQSLDASDKDPENETPIELICGVSDIIAPSHANKCIQTKRRNFKSRAINTCPTDKKDSMCSPIKLVSSKATSPIKVHFNEVSSSDDDDSGSNYTQVTVTSDYK